MTGRAGLGKMPAGTTSGAPQVLLAHHLKQLKLPTVLREHDRVARECARDGVDHPSNLLRLGIGKMAHKILINASPASFSTD